MLQFASISFDAAAEDIYPPLISGARIVMRTEDALDAPMRFMRSCEQEDVTVLDLPTAYWDQITAALAEGEAELPGRVRLMIIGGEKAHAERVRRWRRG